MTTAIYGIVLMEPSTWSSGPLRLTHFCSVTVPAGVWAVQRTTGESPPPLSWHTFTKIDHHRAVVFGGYRYLQGDIYLNDTYVLDMETWVWKCMCLYILICLLCAVLHRKRLKTTFFNILCSYSVMVHGSGTSFISN